MKLFTFLLLMVFLSVLSACSNRDPFYNDGSEWDHLQFPLLKPYYAIYIPTSQKFGWEIALDETPMDRNYYYNSAILRVDKIAFDKGIIMVPHSVFEADSGKPGSRTKEGIALVRPDSESRGIWF